MRCKKKHSLLTVRWLSNIAFVAVLVAWFVIGLGALTRLTDAGLGCPDWPGCYGHISVPTPVKAGAFNRANATSVPLVKHKAWMEMIHRYCAGTLAMLVFLVAVLCVLHAARAGASYFMFAVMIFILVIYQALLGMWTVTLKLWPVVVSQHLLGGMCLLALLWMIFLKSRSDGEVQVWPYSLARPVWANRTVASCGLLLVILQIALGAWTSTNYAALSCPAFPWCTMHGKMIFDVSTAFNVSAWGGANYEGGVLSLIARQTIHMTHRIMAVVVLMYVFFMKVYFYQISQKYRVLRVAMRVLLSLLVLQITLGILNVYFVLPLVVAVSHNLVAALLLCAMVAVNHVVFRVRILKPVLTEKGAAVYE